MFVYRLELDKVGPYSRDDKNFDLKTNDLLAQILYEHNDSDLHPCWLTDFGYKLDSCYLSGCDSLEKLKNWFGNFWNDLIDANFEIFRYESNDIIVGDSGRQLAFVPKGLPQKICPITLDLAIA